MGNQRSWNKPQQHCGKQGEAEVTSLPPPPPIQCPGPAAKHCGKWTWGINMVPAQLILPPTSPEGTKHRGRGGRRLQVWQDFRAPAAKHCGKHVAPAPQAHDTAIGGFLANGGEPHPSEGGLVPSGLGVGFSLPASPSHTATSSWPARPCPGRPYCRRQRRGARG